MLRIPKLHIKHFFILLLILVLVVATSTGISYVQSKQTFDRNEKAVQSEFDKFFSTIKAYNLMLVVNDSLQLNRAQSILTDNNFPLFQFRLIAPEGQELVKFDKFGFNNKNDLASREYWPSVRELTPGDWHITSAQSNWENDSTTGKEFVSSAKTFRFFYKARGSVNSIKNAILAYNVDYDSISQKLTNTHPNIELGFIEPNTGSKLHFSWRGIEKNYILNIEHLGKLMPVLVVHSVYPLRWTAFFTLLALALIIILYLNYLKTQQDRDLELLLEQQQNLFTANWINMASHYFRHPVANITSNLELLTLKGIISKDQREVAKMFNSLDEFLKIFNHLQKVNVLNNLDERPRSPLALSTFINKLSEEYESRIEFMVVCNPAFEVNLDLETFNWSFKELVENALYHGRAQNISVNISEHWDGLQIQIIDDGVGMPRSLVEQLNSQEVEFKSSGIDSGKFGLGYYQVIRIMEQHNFSIRLESSVDQGTTVFINIPDAEYDFPQA